MSNIAISVENISKRYRIGRAQQRHDTLRDAIVAGLQAPLSRWRSNGRHAEDDTIWALKDVSFEVKQGEVVGVIGRNGAGKSTLLKILSQITEPTSGRAVIHGRVGSLLEVGTGFHPELTGRENIYLNGAILGMRRDEIRRQFDEIVAFSEIEKFLDTPVKRYSSGMYVRLAFAVAAHLEPEILLVDEVLAVGDAAFQKKCLGKMSEVASQGRTVLFVSHNMAAIVEFCERIVLLDKGAVRFDGNARQGVKQYLTQNVPDAAERSWAKDKTGPGSGPIRFSYIRLLNASGDVVRQVTNTEDCYVEIGYHVLSDIHGLYVGFQLVTEGGIVVIDSHDQDSQDIFPNGRGAGTYVGRCRLPALLLNEGAYVLNLVAYMPGRDFLVLEEGVLSFEVLYVGGVGPSPRKPGIVRPALEWSVSFGEGQDVHSADSLEAACSYRSAPVEGQ